jgi:LysR family glycine cleavage system transcriptional activator
MIRNPSPQRDPRILRSLQYFEAVARHCSVKDAARELGVSPSAVSHQLRTLKEHVGEELFLKSGRGIRLTGAGTQLSERLNDLLERISQALSETVGRAQPFLRVAVCSSFGPAWLARRLPDFLARHPSLGVELRMYARDPLQTNDVADVIVTAEPRREGFEAVTLFEEKLVAVGSPRMPLGDGGLPQRLITTDIERFDLAQDWVDFGSAMETDYLAAASGGILRCSHYVLALAMAEAGTGAALVPDFLAAGPCKAGTLRQLGSATLPSGRTYRFCYKTARARDPAIRSLERWIKAQSEQARPAPSAAGPNATEVRSAGRKARPAGGTTPER